MNLAGATVTDVAAIATFPALKVLSLDGDQWAAPLGSGGIRAGWPRQS